jgi:hypothetical protein
VTRAIGYGAPGSTVTVLPVGLQVVATHQGVALPGALTATATVVHSLGATASIAGTVLGPLRPVSGSCSSADWTQASVAVQLPSTSITGDGPHRIASAPVTSLGCYALQLRAVFTVSSGGSLTIPVAAGSAAPTFLVLDPVMQVTGAPTWAPAGTAVHVGVAVLGSLHQAGALQLALWRVAPPLTGCPAAKWTAAALISTGASQPTTGDASYAMTAPAARTPGCYRVVPSLTLTAIGSPTAATTDLSLAQFQVTGVAAAFVAPTPPKTDDRWRTWTALSVAAASVLTAIGQAAWLARRMRNADDG